MVRSCAWLSPRCANSAKAQLRTIDFIFISSRTCAILYLDNSLGENSPLARLYDVNAWVLLLGVGYDSCTSFHLAEYRIAQAQQVNRGAPILEAGERVWKVYTDIEFGDDCFVEIGEALEKTGDVKFSTVGLAKIKLFSIRNAVDFAVNWLKTNNR